MTSNVGIVAALASSLALFGASIPGAQANDAYPSKSDFEYFLEESYHQKNKPEAEFDWEDTLFNAAQSEKSPKEMIRRFADDIAFDEADAVIIANAIIEIVKFDDHCSGYRREKTEYDCRFESGAPAYDIFIAANEIDSSGELAFVIGKKVGSDSDPDEWRKTYLDAIVTHPGRTLTFKKLLDYSRSSIWVFALAAAGEIETETAKLIFLSYYYDRMYRKENWNGDVMALLEALLARRSLDYETRALLSASFVSLKMHAGMTADAVSTWVRLPGQLRDYTPGPDGPEARYDNEKVFRNFATYEINLAAALVHQKKIFAAKRLLLKTSDRSNNLEMLDYSNKATFAAIEEVIAPKLSQNDVYDYFLFGKRPEDPEIEVDGVFIGDGFGWLFQLGNAVPAARKITADYLAGRDYVTMSNYLTYKELYYRSDRGDPLIASLTPMLPKSFPARQEYWKGKIEDAWNAHEESRNKTPEVEIPQQEKPSHFTESPLPEEFITTENSSAFSVRFVNDVPEGVVLPVSNYELARYAEENGERQIIYMSGALDATGEVPAYGFWFQQTTNGKKDWGEPIYLGFQQYFPYVVPARSKMPLLSGDALTLEVEAKEIDRESITFPPVGLAIKRDGRNIFITLPFEELLRDSDEDGLTDLVERRLQMNPLSSDTDDDELDDARDPLPLTAFDPFASQSSKEFAYAILSAIVGYERGAIMVGPREEGDEYDLLDMLGDQRPASISSGSVFLKGDPDIFSGVRTPFRLFIFSEDEIARINSEGPPFYPAGVAHQFSRPDGSEHYIIWDASWVGGTFIVRCKDDKCETEVISQWIT